MPRFDSGLTPEAIDELLVGLADPETAAEWEHESGLVVALTLGLLEGDVLELSRAVTVMLPESRAAIEARLAAVRAAIAGGATLRQALELHCQE